MKILDVDLFRQWFAGGTMKSRWSSEPDKFRFGTKVGTAIFDGNDLALVDTMKDLASSAEPFHGVAVVWWSQLEFYISVKGRALNGAVLFKDEVSHQFVPSFSVGAGTRKRNPAPERSCGLLDSVLVRPTTVSKAFEEIQGEIMIERVRGTEGHETADYSLTLS